MTQFNSPFDPKLSLEGLDNPSTFDQILNLVATPISTILDVLDTPGGIVRNALAGKDITPGIFDPSQRASGRDVLTNLFGATTKDERLSLGGFDIGSFLTAVVTDPLLYTGSFTGLTKAGRAASELSKAKQAQGLITKALEILPEGNIEARTLLTKQLDDSIGAIERLTRKGATDLAQATKQGDIFQSAIKNQLEAGQRGFSVSVPFFNAEFTPTGFNRSLAPVIEAADKLKTRLTPDWYERLFRSRPKNLSTRYAKDLSSNIAKGTAVSDAINFVPPELQTTGAFESAMLHAFINRPDFKSALNVADDVVVEISDKGVDNLLKTEQFAAELKHFPTEVMVGAERVGTLDKTYDAFEAANIKLREKVDKQVEALGAKQELLISQGEHTAAAKLNDDFVKLMDKAEKAQHRLNLKYGDRINAIQKDLGVITSRGELTTDLVSTINQAGKDALDYAQQAGISVSDLNTPFVSYVRQVLTPEGAKWFEELPSDIQQEVRKYIGNDLAQTLGFQKKRSLRGLTSAEKNAELADRYDLGFDVFNTNPVVSLKDMTNQINKAAGNAMAINLAINEFGTTSKVGTVPIGEVLADSNLAGIKFKGQDLRFESRYGAKGISSQIKKQLGHNLYLPADVAKDVGRMTHYHLGEATGLLQRIQPINSIYRTLFTSVPAHAATNAIGAIWSNTFAGVGNPQTYIDAAKAVGAFFKKHRPDAPLAKFLPDFGDEAIAPFAEFFNSGTADKGFFSEVTRQVRLGERGRGPLPFLAKKLADTKFARITREANQMIDEIARATHFVEKRRAGATLLEAEESVKKYLFDYSELTPFEKNTLSKAVLFYTFSRKNLPFSIQETFSNRGVRGLAFLSRDSLQNQTSVPEFIDEQGNIGLSDGTFLDIKNPLFEANKFSPQGGGLERILDKVLTQVTPPLKVPLELALNREFFRGRKLTDVNRINDTILGIPSDKFPFVQSIQTDSGTEYRIPKLLQGLSDLNPASRFNQIARDITRPDFSVANLVGFRKRSYDPDVLLAKNVQDRILNIIENDPRLRTFSKPFAIEPKPGKDITRILKLLDEAQNIIKNSSNSYR